MTPHDNFTAPLDSVTSVNTAVPSAAEVFRNANTDSSSSYPLSPPRKRRSRVLR